MERFIKPSIWLGAISGAVFGILLLIPFIAPFMFFFSFLLTGIIVIVVLKKTNTVGILTMQDGALIGAIAGFCSLITTSAFYLPIAFIIDKIFNVYSEGFSLSRSLSITGYDVMAISMLVFFTAVLSAIINAFTGMLTAFVFDRIENQGMNFEDHLHSEQFDETIQ